MALSNLHDSESKLKNLLERIIYLQFSRVAGRWKIRMRRPRIETGDVIVVIFILIKN